MEDRIATLQRSLEDVPFAAIEWEYDNSHRENCCFNTIYVISMLEDWKASKHVVPFLSCAFDSISVP